MNAILILCIWLLFAPVGYIASRWSNRKMGMKWTRNDRLFSIIASIFFGPMAIVIMLLVTAIDKIVTSEWGNKDVRW